MACGAPPLGASPPIAWTRVRNGRKSRSAPTTRAKQADKTGQGYAQPWQQGNCRRLLTHNPLAHRHPLVHSHRRRHCPRPLRAAGADLRDGLLAAVDDRGFALERPASDADGARRGGPDGRPLDHVRRQDRPALRRAAQLAIRACPAGNRCCSPSWSCGTRGGRRRKEVPPAMGMGMDGRGAALAAYFQLIRADLRVA